MLLSSHILAEVQQVCTSATIIGNGRMLAVGHRRRAARRRPGRRTGCGSPIRGPPAHVLADAGFAVSDHVDGLLTVEGGRPPEDISRALGERGHWVAELTPVRVDLETFFLELTRDEQLGVASVRLLRVGARPGSAGAGPWKVLLVAGLRHPARRPGRDCVVDAARPPNSPSSPRHG